MNLKIPKDVYDILDTLEKAGYEAYIVGGCVRDFYLGSKPHDWDITTNAKPDEVKKLFKKTIDTGIQHGTVTAMVNNEGYEITTYRIDGEYEDNRRPSSVEFTGDLVKDLERRDLTFNAMVMDKEGNIKDFFDGKKDLDNKIVRAVGNPNKRFQEDALRMMRAIRFAAKFGFELESELYEAIKSNAHLIKNVSYERIESEITKILTSNHPEKFLDLYTTGITKYIMPEFDKMMETEQNTPWHLYSVGMHTIKAVCAIENDRNLRWAMLLHDVGKPDAKTTDEKGQDHFYGHNENGTDIASEIMKRMKFSTKDLKEIQSLIFLHDIHYKKMPKIRKFVADYGIDFARRLIKIQRADIEAQSSYNYEEKVESVNILESNIETVYKDGSAIRLTDLKINGNDLMKIGYKGKEIGDELYRLREIVLQSPNLNTKEDLLRRSKSNYDKTHTLDDIIKTKTSNKKNNEENVVLKDQINRD